jgi:hypothetical protein
VSQLQQHAKIFLLKEDELDNDERACDSFQNRYYSYQISDTHYVIGDHLLDDTTGWEEQILIPKAIIKQGDAVNYFKWKVLKWYLHKTHYPSIWEWIEDEPAYSDMLIP